MPVSFIFPSHTVKGFQNDIDQVNTGIRRRNLRGVLPHMLNLFVALLLLRVLSTLSLLLFRHTVIRVTAASEETIIRGLLLAAVLPCAGFLGVMMLYKKLDALIRKEETFTLSVYAEREDPAKYAAGEAEYLETCARIKQGKIKDCTIDTSSDTCSVTVIYTDPLDVEKTEHFLLPWRISSGVTDTTVDLNRKIVLFAEHRNS